MKTILTGALTALTLAGALSAMALPAAAEDHHGWRGDHSEWRGDRRDGWGGDHSEWRGDRRDGWGGDSALLGLAVGAAIAGAPYGYPAYYGPPCRIEMRWNPYWGGYERVRVCD